MKNSSRHHSKPRHIYDSKETARACKEPLHHRNHCKSLWIVFDSCMSKYRIIESSQLVYNPVNITPVMIPAGVEITCIVHYRIHQRAVLFMRSNIGCKHDLDAPLARFEETSVIKWLNSHVLGNDNTITPNHVDTEIKGHSLCMLDKFQRGETYVPLIIFIQSPKLYSSFILWINRIKDSFRSNNHYK